MRSTLAGICIGITFFLCCAVIGAAGQGTTYTPPESAVTPEGARPEAPPFGTTINPSAKHIDGAGLLLIERFEGYSRCAYQDVTGVWTAGFGQTHGVGPGFCFRDEAAAQANLKFAVEYEYEWAIRAVVGNGAGQNEWDALCSFAYNLGAGIFTGELRAVLRERALGLAAQIMLQYDHAGGRVLPGLRTRREAEARLLLTPDRKPTSKPKPRPNLAALTAKREALREDLTAHKCRIAPYHGRGRYHAICAEWIRQGAAVNREIKALRG